MAAIGTEEGALDDLEGSVISNVISLDEILVKDILTPRVVVFRLPEDQPLSTLRDEISNWNFSRIPIYSENDPDHLYSYVTQRDIYRELLRGNEHLALKDIARPLDTVPELMPVDKLITRMFRKNEHILSVVDEHGGLAGIISLEDILEEIVGQEIVDEYDSVKDLRSFARLLRMSESRKRRKTSGVNRKKTDPQKGR